MRYDMTLLSQMQFDYPKKCESEAPTDPNVAFSLIIAPRREGVLLGLNYS
jgi:hypothetical protein